jgi:hypothetical protein
MAHEPHSLIAVRVRVTLLLVVFRQSVHLGVKPLEPHDQRFFFFWQLNPCSHSPNATSLTRRCVCVLWIGLAFVKHMSTCRTYSMLLKILPFGLYKSPLTVLMFCYNARLITRTVVSLTATKFKPFIFSASDFTLSYAAHMFIFMILYDFCLLPAQSCCIIVYLQKVESNVQIVDWWCTLENFLCCGEPCFTGAGILRDRCLPQIPRQGKHKLLLK